MQAYEKLDRISVKFRKRQEENRDILAVVSGEKGDGKSNLTMQAARDYIDKFGMVCSDCLYEWIYTGQALVGIREGENIVLDARDGLAEDCPKCNSKNTKRLTTFNFNVWLAYDASEVREKIFSLPQFSPIISDELARFAMAEAWNTTESREMKQLLIQVRTKNLILLGNIPEFVTLDKKYRNMANYWIRLLARNKSGACALFFKKSKGEFDDRFHIKELQEIMGDYFEDEDMDDIQTMAMKINQKHPCCEDWFMIPPLPKAIYDAYEEYRNKKVFERKPEDGIKLDRKQLAKIVLYNLYTNFDRIAEEVNKTKLKRMNYETLLGFVCRNPKTMEPELTMPTISKWMIEVRDATGDARVKVEGEK